MSWQVRCARCLLTPWGSATTLGALQQASRRRWPVHVAPNCVAMSVQPAQSSAPNVAPAAHLQAQLQQPQQLQIAPAPAGPTPHQLAAQQQLDSLQQQQQAQMEQMQQQKQGQMAAAQAAISAAAPPPVAAPRGGAGREAGQDGWRELLK